MFSQTYRTDRAWLMMQCTSVRLPCPLQGRHDISSRLYSGPPLLPTQPWLDIDGNELGSWVREIMPPSRRHPKILPTRDPMSIELNCEAWLKAGFDLYGEYFRSRNTRESRNRSFIFVKYLTFHTFRTGTSTNLLNGHTTKVIASRYLHG